MSYSMPGHWMNETSGNLRAAVEAFLINAPLNAEQVTVLRVYFRQWITAPRFHGSMVDVLRSSVDAISDRADVERWLYRAQDAGCDPL